MRGVPRDDRRVWSSLHYGGRDHEPPTAEQIERWHRHMAVPDNEFPTGIGATTLLASTDDAAVGVTHLEAFSTGFRFTLAVRVRQVPSRLAGGGLFMLVGGHVHPGVQVSLEDRLLLGIEYSDGRRASTLQDGRMNSPDALVGDEELVLLSQGGGGGDLSVDQAYWVAPLPPEGPVAVLLRWPAFGMPESRTVLDGAAIRAAGSSSRILWPPQPTIEPPSSPPPPRPTSGWFSGTSA